MKVTLRRMAKFMSVRYETTLIQGSRIQWWCLFHYQNNTVSEKKSAGPQLPWFSALSYLTLINWAILHKVTFLGYPWDPSWGPEDIILDTAGIWGWNSWGHWIQQPCFRSLSYPKLQFWAKGTKVVGLPTCVAQLLPIWPWAFSLNTRLKATGVTDLGSKGTYGIGGLSRKKYVKFSQKACS